MWCMAILMSFFLCPVQEAKKTTAEISQAWNCCCSGEQRAENKWQQESRLCRASIISEYGRKAEETGACYSHHMADKETLVVPLYVCVLPLPVASGTAAPKWKEGKSCQMHQRKLIRLMPSFRWCQTSAYHVTEKIWFQFLSLAFC